MAIEVRHSRGKVIRADRRTGGQGQPFDDLPGDPAHPVRWNNVVGEGGAAGTVRIPGERIVDGRSIAAEVTSPRLEGRHGEEPRHIAFTIGLLVAAEEEQLVPDNRSAERAPPLVLIELRLLGVEIEDVSRFQRAVDVVLEDGAVSSGSHRGTR